MQEDLKEVFFYKDGNFYWKNDRGRKIKAGSIAGYKDKSSGYRRLHFNGKTYNFHRLVYMYHYGYFPEFVDHIDGDKENNKIENLRGCTRCENSQNTGIRSHNTSGVKGVYRNKIKNKWVAGIRANREYIYLGSFNQLEDAEAAVIEGRKKHHKEFANFN